MNLFTSDLFTPVMQEALASRTPRSYRAPAFGRRYGRATAMPMHATPSVLPAPCVVEASDERVLLDYDLAA